MPSAISNGALSAQEVPLAAIAEAVGTPFYCYAASALIANYRAFSEALPAGTLVAYAVKANSNLAVLATLANEGAGADIVSGGELARALRAGVPASRIVFSGVGKTEEEMRAALLAGILEFNVESEPELEALNRVARSLGKRAPVMIRVNPDVDANTHEKITTGTAEAKFGIPWPRAGEAVARAAGFGGIDVVGLHVHVGSQILDLAPFEASYARVLDLVRELRAAGLRIARLDVGGGFGVPYAAAEEALDLSAYGAMLARLTRGMDLRLVVEPGRYIAADAGVLVSRVLYMKHTPVQNFMILDAGMNDLIRPALYGAHHEILPVAEAAQGAPRAPYDVVGPICESSDTFAHDRMLPPMRAGELVAIMHAGAYGASMGSTYNSRLPAAEVMVKGDEWSVVRPRPVLESLFEGERLPRLAGTGRLGGAPQGRISVVLQLVDFPQLASAEVQVRPKRHQRRAPDLALQNVQLFEPPAVLRPQDHVDVGLAGERDFFGTQHEFGVDADVEKNFGHRIVAEIHGQPHDELADIGILEFAALDLLQQMFVGLVLLDQPGVDAAFTLAEDKKKSGRQADEHEQSCEQGLRFEIVEQRMQRNRDGKARQQ